MIFTSLWEERPFTFGKYFAEFSSFFRGSESIFLGMGRHKDLELRSHFDADNPNDNGDIACRKCGQFVSDRTDHLRTHFEKCKEKPASSSAGDRSASGSGAKEGRSATPSVRRVVQTEFVVQVHKQPAKMSAIDVLALDLMLARAIISGSVAFRFVENRYFCEFLRMLNDRYRPPTRQRLATTLLDSVFEECHEKAAIPPEHLVTLQADGWCNNHGERAFGVVAMSEDRVPKIADISFVGSEKEDGAMVASKLKKVIDQIGPERVVSVTTDHAGNMRCGMERLVGDESKAYEHILWIPCVCHLLHLIQQAMVEKEPALNAVMRSFVKLAKAITKSVVLRPQVERQKKTGPESTSYGAAVHSIARTRWGSRVGCLHSLLGAKKAIQETFNRVDIIKRCTNQKRMRKMQELVQDEHNWIEARWIYRFLLPFHLALRRMEQSASDLGLAFRCLAQLRNHVTRMSAALTRATLPRRANWNHIVSIFDSYVLPDVSDVMHAAYHLHPLTIIKPLPESVVQGLQGSGPPHAVRARQGISELQKKSSRAEQVRMLLEMHAFQESVPPTEQAVVHGLRASSILITGFIKGMSASKWWKDLMEELPSLSSVGQRAFQIPAASSGIERTWAVFRHVQTSIRSRLGFEKSNKLAECFQQLNATHQQCDVRAREGSGCCPHADATDSDSADMMSELEVESPGEELEDEAGELCVLDEDKIHPEDSGEEADDSGTEKRPVRERKPKKRRAEKTTYLEYTDDSDDDFVYSDDSDGADWSDADEEKRKPKPKANGSVTGKTHKSGKREEGEEGSDDPLEVSTGPKAAAPAAGQTASSMNRKSGGEEGTRGVHEEELAPAAGNVMQVQLREPSERRKRKAESDDEEEFAQVVPQKKAKRTKK
jgi:hypothetical protein